MQFSDYTPPKDLRQVSPERLAMNAMLLSLGHCAVQQQILAKLSGVEVAGDPTIEAKG